MISVRDTTLLDDRVIVISTLAHEAHIASQLSASILLDLKFGYSTLRCRCDLHLMDTRRRLTCSFVRRKMLLRYLVLLKVL